MRQSVQHGSKSFTGSWLLAGLMCLGLMGAVAPAQTTMRVRGTITRFDGHVLEVKARDGSELNLSVSADTAVSSVVRLGVGDIKQGAFVGVTAIEKGAGGVLYAMEVHVIPEASRGAGEGHHDWDLVPGSTMTNANVDAIVDANDGKELTLSYRGGTQKITVPPGTPIVAFAPATQELLKAGATIFALAQRTDGGIPAARRVIVGTNGLKPPM